MSEVVNISICPFDGARSSHKRKKKCRMREIERFLGVFLKIRTLNHFRAVKFKKDGEIQVSGGEIHVSGGEIRFVRRRNSNPNLVREFPELGARISELGARILVLVSVVSE